ncbi:low-affinity glucose transporter HXT1 [Colletotrichum nymphaeae SA-01]|uniref:Low-affinity glucose transporter HXT1 n=1 Tax=Colletotrichum nymphaeae SA-01 TaxID=1460502 RepID=A0A135RWQ7_9PEZI|nr:low-affinity glucose transporter HXT1 [Colletotrichum nymphaeae SA-01]
MGHAKEANAKAVGAELAAVLPDIGPWYKQAHILRLNLCIASLIMCASANGYDGSMMNGLHALPQWHAFMKQPTGAWLGFVNAAYSLGNVLVYPVAAWVCNKYGRKMGIYISWVCLGTGSILQTAAPNDAAFVCARFLIGCASGFFLSAPLLITENAYPTHRGMVSALYNCGWYFGAVVAAWATYGTRNLDHWAWRLPSLLQVTLPVLSIPGLLFIGESPRWLVSVDRTDEARAIIARNHAGGDTHSPLVNFEMMEIENTIRAEKEAHSETKWSDLWATPGNRHRLFISVSLGVFAQWCGVGVVSYYLAMVLSSVGITSVDDQTLISACIQIWNLICASTAAIMVDRAGRRGLFLASGTIMLISFSIVTGLSGSFANTGNAPTGTAVIPFLFIFYLGYDIALTPLMVSYPVEIWPYRLRAKGLTVALMVSIGCVFFNTFVNPVALEAIEWKYYFVFLAVLVIMLISVWFYYPETRGRTLENMAYIFDGESAEVGTGNASSALKEAEASHVEVTHKS